MKTLETLIIHLMIIIAFLTVIWLIGSFLSLDYLWFWHSLFGRVIALIFFIIAVRGAIKTEIES